jgi:hypothetical protein
LILSPAWLASGIHIVTTNNKANSADLESYACDRARSRLRSADRCYRWESGGLREPLCELFGEIGISAGMEWWRAAFSSGMAHQNIGLKFVRTIEP